MKSPRGFVMFVVLGALAALTLLISQGLSRALADRRAARQDLATAQARLAAEGAAEMGLARGGSGSGKLGPATYTYSTRSGVVRAEGRAGDVKWVVEASFKPKARGVEITGWRENPQ